MMQFCPNASAKGNLEVAKAHGAEAAYFGSVLLVDLRENNAVVIKTSEPQLNLEARAH